MAASGGGGLSTFDADVESWEELARRDPLWAVLSKDELHQSELTPVAEEGFWQSGEEHVGHVLAVLRNEIDPAFSPTVSLDFGCGVGRNLVPLAKRSRHAIGLDASPTMVARARDRIEGSGLSNATALLSGRSIDSAALSEHGAIDFVHSVLVFQHIVPAEGMALFDELLDVLAPGGFGFVHFFCQGPGAGLERLVRGLRFEHPRLNQLAIKSRIRVLNRVVMLYEYDPVELLSHLAAHRISDVVFERVEAGSSGYHARFYFRKDADEHTSAEAGRPMSLRLRP